MPALKRLGLTLTLLLAAVLLQGCSAIKLVYKQADTLLYWRLDSYVDFSDEQAPRVREGLKQFHQWHRGSQLPLYADLLQRIGPQLREPVTAEQACAVFDQVRDLAETTLDPAHWPLLWLPGELSEEQLKHIERKQASSDADWQKEWGKLPAEQLQQKRFDQLLSRSEMLYGHLDEPQKAVLRAGLAASSFDPARSYAERLRREQDLRQTLRKIHDERLGPDATRDLLKAYVGRALRPQDPAQQRYSETLTREGCANFARLHNATTPAQRARAMQTVKAYEDDFRLLASQR